MLELNWHSYKVKLIDQNGKLTNNGLGPCQCFRRQLNINEGQVQLAEVSDHADSLRRSEFANPPKCKYLINSKEYCFIHNFIKLPIVKKQYSL